jgi:hypothetical protein
MSLSLYFTRLTYERATVRVRCGYNMTDREQKQLYVTLFSNAGQDLYPANTLSACRVELAKPIVLNPSYRWEVGLCEFSCVPLATGTVKPNVLVGDVTALIYCNIISPQFVGGNLVRCLRTVMQPSQTCTFNFETVYYMPVEKNLYKYLDKNLIIVRNRCVVQGYQHTHKIGSAFWSSRQVLGDLYI